MLDEFCFKSKNLYNFANFHVRQEFINNGRWLRYGETDKMLKRSGVELDYRSMPAADTAQQTLRLLERNWKSFFAATKEYARSPDKFTGRPKLPKYLPKNGRSVLILSVNSCKLRGDVVKFPKVFNGFTLKTRVDNVQQVRILPRRRHLIIEVVHNVEVQVLKGDNNRYLGIDIGVDNFATVANNVGAQPIIVNGKGLKSVNKFYNKRVSHCREVAKRMNSMDYTRRMNQLTIKLNNRVTDAIHKASRLVVNHALKLNINTIIIGNNKDWKRKSKLNKVVNQSFVGLPHQEFINKVVYKAESVGINVILTEESFTSGTSFLDNEPPTRELYDKSRRIHRGLFRTNGGLLINADLNGAFQIMRKVFPNVNADGIEGVGLRPVRVNIV